MDMLQKRFLKIFEDSSVECDCILGTSEATYFHQHLLASAVLLCQADAVEEVAWCHFSIPVIMYKRPRC